MNRPTVAEVNCSTGEAILREMTDEEYAQYLVDVEAHEAQQEQVNE